MRSPKKALSQEDVQKVQLFEPALIDLHLNTKNGYVVFYSVNTVNITIFYVRSKICDII